LEIDCVFDDTLAEELATYLKKKGHAMIRENSTITTRNDPIDDVVNFAIKTHREDYQINFFEDRLIFSRKVSMERIGLLSCKQCGFLASAKSDLEYHQGTHLPKNWILHHS
jgi:hypothetical protein